MSASEHLNPSAYIDFKNLPREYDTLKAKYDVLFREYLALSSEAAHLKRKLIRYLASDWIVVSAHPEPHRAPNNQPRRHDMEHLDAIDDQDTELSKLKQEYAALKAKHEELIRDYATLSAKAASLEREAKRHSTKGWAVVNPYR